MAGLTTRSLTLPATRRLLLSLLSTTCLFHLSQINQKCSKHHGIVMNSMTQRRQVIRLPILLHLQLSQSILRLKIHVKLPSPKGLQNLSSLHLPVLDQFFEVELLCVYMCNLQLAGNVHQVL